jgi:hypothetical protein
MHDTLGMAFGSGSSDGRMRSERVVPAEQRRTYRLKDIAVQSIRRWFYTADRLH